MDKKMDDALDDEIDSIEAESFVPYLTPTVSPEQAIRMMEGCPVCGCKLHFTNFSDFTRMVSHEVVRCDECGYRAKKDLTNIQ
jgi:hypothetical protein